jgi:ATP-dependent Clp protease ATP-binding subunit ClpA
MNGYNFTDRVRRVLQMARDQAARLQHEYVGTEHLLLALVLEGEGVAAAALTNLNIDLEDVRGYIEDTVKKGTAAARATGPDFPYTSRAKKILEFSMAEARDLNHSYVGTEHLLLGILREEKGIGAQALIEMGLTLEITRAEVLRLLGTDESARGHSSSEPRRMRSVEVVPGTAFVPGMAHALQDYWFRMAIALIELHRLRSGQYPETLEDLRSSLGPFEQPVLQRVRYEKLDDGYALDNIMPRDGEATLSYPAEFWRGLGIRRTNVEGFKSP